MATTVTSIPSQSRTHRRSVGFAVAALFVVGGAVATTAAIAAYDNDSSSTKPAQHEVSNPSAHPDPLVTRYGSPDSVPFADQPQLRLGGAR